MKDHCDEITGIIGSDDSIADGIKADIRVIGIMIDSIGDCQALDVEDDQGFIGCGSE